MAMSSEGESDSESEEVVKRRDETDSEIEKLENKGVLTAQEFKKLTERRKKEDEINKLSEQYRNAPTIIRDK